MSWHENNKKKEKKTEQTKHHLKNILRNSLCAAVGASILVVGIMAPRTIFAMMDQKEVDKIYIREADMSYLDTASQMSMEEKLDLWDWKSSETHISSSYPVGSTDLYDKDGTLQGQVASQVEEMQKRHLVPELDFRVRDIDMNVMYETLINLENMNQYLTLAYMTFQVSDDYLYVTVDTETGKILGYTVYADMTEQEWERLLTADVTGYMAENLGVSEDTVIKKYNYGIFNETYGEAYNMDLEGVLTANPDDAGAHMPGETQFVQIGMWMEDPETSSVGESYDSNVDGMIE